MSRHIKLLYRRILLLVNRIRFHLFFKRTPATGNYCNSKRIVIEKRPSCGPTGRKFLAFIRCGAAHRLIDDGGERLFDIALNRYAKPTDSKETPCEYLIAGGLNKYKAAYQFMDGNVLSGYKGFIFLDDDLEISYTELGGFLTFCFKNNFSMAQPSLTIDSYFSHEYLLQKAISSWRRVEMIEVMCPYFSKNALKAAIHTFDLSYSTWGLDYLWPRLGDAKPVVVDAFKIKHTKQVSRSGGFYKYMQRIGVSPDQELKKLKGLSQEKFSP